MSCKFGLLVTAWLVSLCMSQICKKSPNEKIDCCPEYMCTKTKCQSRGCCWLPPPGYFNESLLTQIEPPKTVPFCFFPTNFPSYTTLSLTPSSTGYKAELEQQVSTYLPNERPKLTFEASCQKDSVVHVTITDAMQPRWVVPVPLTSPEKVNCADSDFLVTVSKKPFGFKVARKSDTATLFDTSVDAPLLFADQFIQMTAKLNASRLYGIGGRRAQFSQKFEWKTIPLWSFDQPIGTDVNLYGMHNFYVARTSQGTAFGVLFLNSNAQEIDILPMPGVTYRTIGGIIDLYFFAGPTLKRVVQQYVTKIGTPPLPPYWSLGFHLCKYGYGNLTHLKEVVRRNRALKIPYDVQWTDIDYMDAYKDWTISPERYGELPAFVDYMHSVNMKYVPIVDPGISNQYPGKYAPYDVGLTRKVFIISPTDPDSPLVGVVWPGTVVYPDFSNPTTIEWWIKCAEDFYKVVKFDGLWIDMNEPSNFVSGSVHGCSNTSLDFPPYVPHLRGGPINTKTVCGSANQHLSKHYNIHGLYGYHETAATHDALTQIGSSKRPFILSRSTFVGSGKWGYHWTGDNSATWSDLYYSISMIMNFNMFGIPMVGADVCGFVGDTNEELCVRWMQLGAFYPFMRNHDDIHAREQDPAVWSKEAIDIMRQALLDRYSRLPYTYTVFHTANVSGLPVFKPVAFEFPADSNVTDVDTAFMYGPAMMVWPVLQSGARNVSVYIPKGIWYDGFTGKRTTCEQCHFIADAPLSRIPHFMTGGHVVPSQYPALTTTESRRNPFYLSAYLDEHQQANGTLYWDDGETRTTDPNHKFTFVKFTVKPQTFYVIPVVTGYTNESIVLKRISIIGLHNKPGRVYAGTRDVTFEYDETCDTLIVDNIYVNIFRAAKFTWY